MILMSLALFLHACSMFEMRVLTTFSSLSMTDKLEMSRFLMTDEMSLMNKSSSSLFFIIENLDVLMFSSTIGMKIMRET